MKLALFGGSFDPPHIGHVEVITEALSVLDIDKLIIVPAWRNPFKLSVVAEGEVRYGWLKEIFAETKKVEISDFEIMQGRSVYTVDTVKHYARLCDKIYLIIGADNLESLKKWHAYDELNTMVQWVVACRNNIPIPENMIRLTINAPISSSDFRTSGAALGLRPNIEQKITTYYKEHL